MTEPTCFYSECTKEAKPRKKRWHFPLCTEHLAEVTRLYEAINHDDPKSPAGFVRFWAKCERAHPEHGKMQLTKKEVAELMGPALARLQERIRKARQAQP